MENQKAFNEQIKAIYRLLMVLFSLFVLAGGALVYYANNPSAFNFSSNSDTVAAVPEEVDEDLIVDGIHVRTGLIDDEGLMVVVNNCTNCHSAKIVTQNRMNEERWNTTIKWMQETQNLWDLGKNQEIIVNYLVKNYPPVAKGRRMALSEIEWYELEN
jgi:hypothetical protein